MARFPHIEQSGSFPGVSNVNVWKYENEMDYSRFDTEQMRITVCAVPWDLGEAHVGQRVIEGVGNVVDFGSESARDAWFDALEEGNGCRRFQTKYRRFHSTDVIQVPIPATSLGEFNYIEVKYYPEPGIGDDLDNTSDDPIDRWYYFIRKINRRASNTSECEIMLDTWQTCLYRIDIPYMFLQRGHWAVANSDVDAYLSNPANNSEYLLTPDVSFGDISRVVKTSAAVLNDDVMACFVTTGDVSASATWGSIGGADWQAPASYSALIQGATGPSAFCIEPENLGSFLNAIESKYPQFAQTVQGVFFAPRKLLSLGSPFHFFGVAAYILNPQKAVIDLLELTKTAFGYAEDYADLAKLYTYPYAAIDLYTEAGDTVRVNIEDTTGALSITAALQVTYPWITVDAHYNGLGGSGGSGSITFYNAQQHAMSYGGMWYQKLMRWDIPVYGVVQSAGTANFSTYWDRQQTLTAAANAQDSEEASANLTVTNAAVQTGANGAINARSNQAAITDTSYGNGLNQALQAWNAGYTRDTTAAEIEGEQLQAAVGAAAGVVGSAASGAMSGGPIGALGGLISGAISGGASMANTAIAANLASSKAELTIGNTQAQVSETNNNNSDKVANQTSANTNNTATTNRAATSVASNSAAVGVANAARGYATQSSAVANQQKQAKLGAPNLYGSPANGQTATTRPMAAFTSVVTQSPAAIAQAGDAFLRYGYRLERAINFSGFNVMPKFSFWQCSDMWLRSSSVPDAYLDQIRMLLFGGVTVWRSPGDIGNTAITDNKEG
jgi:hypothetical protein